MEIETIQKIIEMLGNATESAATIAILWVAGGYLITLIGWVFSWFIVKYIAGLAYNYFSAGVTKSEYDTVVDRLSAQVRISRDEQETAKIAAEKHKAELEKVKHLYKILKESKSND
jgi:hypothetical protein